LDGAIASLGSAGYATFDAAFEVGNNLWTTRKEARAA
jgi:hypothetical protein